VSDAEKPRYIPQEYRPKDMADALRIIRVLLDERDEARDGYIDLTIKELARETRA
jgi:hypothetical protein